MYFETAIDDLIDNFQYIDEKLSVRSVDGQKELIEMVEYQITSVEWVEILFLYWKWNDLNHFFPKCYSKMKDIAEYLNFIIFWNMLNALSTMSMSLFMFTQVGWIQFANRFVKWKFLFRILKVEVCLPSSLLMHFWYKPCPRWSYAIMEIVLHWSLCSWPMLFIIHVGIIGQRNRIENDDSFWSKRALFERLRYFSVLIGNLSDFSEQS